MADMWKSRSPPTPLDYDAILKGTFTTQNGNGVASSSSSVASGSGQNNGSSKPVTNGQANGTASASSLKDQRALSLKDNLDLFISRWDLTSGSCPFVLILFKSTNRLATRLRNGEDTITFDKDDDDTLDFVTASSNLRSYAYGIEGKTRWEVKGLSSSLR
jgi:ubiquitin-like 1-activating enzyme E1 B